MKKGQAIKVGPYAGEIVKAKDSSWEEGAMDVSLSFKRDMSDLAEVVFLDAQGKPIESERTGSSRSEVFGRVSTTLGYQLSKRVPAVTLVFKVWKDAELIKIPVDLTVDVGL